MVVEPGGYAYASINGLGTCFVIQVPSYPADAVEVEEKSLAGVGHLLAHVHGSIQLAS